MQAAAHGKSTIGIPKSVGDEFTDSPPSHEPDAPGEMKAQWSAKKPKKGWRDK